MSYMVRFYAIAAALAMLMLFPAGGFAAVEIGASPNPVGSGARAMGMGGAFIAVADDATAASWNPAGLVQLERPEVSAVGSFLDRMEDVRSHSHQEMNGMNRTETWDLNYLSIVYPFTVLNRNVTVSLNHQKLYDMNKDFHGWRFDMPGGGFEITSEDLFEQRGSLTTVSPAVAFQVTPDLSFGFTYNFWVNPFRDNGWYSYYNQDLLSTITIGQIVIPIVDGTIAIRDDFDFYGTNFHAGVMYNITPDLTVAGVYKDGFKARLRRTRTTTNSDVNAVTPYLHETDFLELTMPRSYGVGVSYRYSDALTLALDIYRTEWCEFIMNNNGEQTRSNILKRESQSKMDATTQVRGGLEYLVIMPTYVVPLRVGGFYDPDPSENAPNDFFGFSLGTGLAIDPFAFDIAYSYRTGKSAEMLGLPAVDSYVENHQVMFSLIYYLDWLNFYE